MAALQVNILFSKEKVKILYLEAGKDFIDLLMALLRMPTASLLRLLSNAGMTTKKPVGIFNVFSSAENLDSSYMKVDKSFVVSPSPPEGTQVRLLGFVKETLTFMVTDNLEFYPSSTIKSISLLNTLGVKSMADLESCETTVSQDHALALVQAALTSSTALNDVFGSLLTVSRRK
ncbi:unnamed protein product [Closterium sp. NIES-54]